MSNSKWTKDATKKKHQENKSTKDTKIHHTCRKIRPHTNTWIRIEMWRLEGGKTLQYRTCLESHIQTIQVSRKVNLSAWSVLMRRRMTTMPLIASHIFSDLYHQLDHALTWTFPNVYPLHSLVCLSLSSSCFEPDLLSGIFSPVSLFILLSWFISFPLTPTIIFITL